jgi:cytoskeleton protein RodZ
MSSDASGFDERRVIGELVQLQAAIRASREKRERAQAAFDAQLSTFRAPTEAVRPDAGVTMTPGALPVPVPRRQPEGPVTIAAVETAPPPLAVEPVEAKLTAAPTLSIPQRRGLQARSRAIVGAIGFVGLAVLVWLLLRAPEEPAAARPDTRPSAAAQPAPAPAQAPAPAPADPHPLRIDIVTLRKVWMRVVVDGRIAIERELPEGERLPFGADKTIVVRAGDAGAVSVRVGSEDQGTLGGDGQVVTRTFTVAPR